MEELSLLAKELGELKVTHAALVQRAAALERDLAFFRKYGLVTAPDITADRIVDMSFAREAAKALGPYAHAP